MLKYLGEPTITFAEFPDEISLIWNLSNCPCHCEGCSEPELQTDIGDLLTDAVLVEAVKKNPGITLIGFMGGDADTADLVELIKWIKKNYPALKVGMYSGRDYLDLDLLNLLDYYKIGRWIMPQGPSDSWCKQVCGPLNFPNSNQLMFKRSGNKFVNITDKFRRKPLNNLERQIIK